MSKPKYYVVVMRGDIEPELHGPFGSQRARDRAAWEYRAEHGDDDGIFALDIGGKVHVDMWAYSGGFFAGEMP